MNPEVLRLLNYMAAFSQPEFRGPVARSMDLILNSPAVHTLIAAGRKGDVHIPYPVAILAAEAVDYIEGRTTEFPEWLKQLGFVPAGEAKHVMVGKKIVRTGEFQLA